eukprot:1280543-Lingulodinium_polyedra.AAC.1
MTSSRVALDLVDQSDKKDCKQHAEEQDIISHRGLATSPKEFKRVEGLIAKAMAKSKAKGASKV